MKNFTIYIITAVCLFWANEVFSQKGEMKVIKVPELEQLMVQADSKKLTIINFWATWCKPCVKELPYFVKAQNQFPDVNFIYMSIDFSENVAKAEKFAQKKELDPEGLYLIDDVDYNSWIDKVSPEWTGAIPATLFILDGKKILYEKEFHEGELQELIEQKVN